jgi:hypothetical protein
LGAELQKMGEEPTFSGYGKSYRATELNQEEKSKNNKQKW